VDVDGGGVVGVAAAAVSYVAVAVADWRSAPCDNGGDKLDGDASDSAGFFELASTSATDPSNVTSATAAAKERDDVLKSTSYSLDAPSWVAFASPTPSYSSCSSSLPISA
jgi:hypothetical protein